MRCGTALRKWVSRPKRSAGQTCYFKLYFTFRRRLPARQGSARQRPAFAPFPGGAAESFRRSASAIRATALREAKGRIARKKSDMARDIDGVRQGRDQHLRHRHSCQNNSPGDNAPRQAPPL